MGIDHRSPDIGMAKKHLDFPDIDTLHQKVGGEGVSISD